MNSEISIDVDMLEQLPAKTVLRLVDKSKRTRKYLEQFQTAVRECAPLFKHLEDLDIDPNFNFNDGCIDISFSGDVHKLGDVWGELRRHGWKTDSRPTKGQTGFSTFWYRGAYCDEQARIWMSFTSALCRRVQVGTKMVEQPIYEIQCGDELPALEAPAAPPAEIVPAAPEADIPF